MQAHHQTTHHKPIYGIFYKYHFIGNGAQFRVYAIHDHRDQPIGRVIKVPLEFHETAQVIREPLSRIATYDTEEELNELAIKRTHDVRQYNNSLLNMIQGAYGRDDDFMHKLGNLRILQAPIPAASVGHGSSPSYTLPIFYTQDQVTTVTSFWNNFQMANVPYMNSLSRTDIKLAKDLVEQIIQLNYAISEYGFFEFVFKPENMGIRFTKDNQIDVIWIDPAEHITDLERAQIILEEKHWLHPLMAHKVDYAYLPTVLHQYYTEACEKAFTQESLQKYWRRKSLKLERKQRRILQLKSLITRNQKQSVRLWIAQQTLRTTMYSGFSGNRIDNLQIPISDLVLLLQDKPPLMSASVASIEVERRLAETKSEVGAAKSQLLLQYLGEHR